MPLNFTTAPITFTKGLDTRSARKLVVPGKWDTLSNLSLSQDGSLKRRDGFGPLIAGQTGNGLAAHDDELLSINRKAVTTVSDAAAVVGKQTNGTLPYVDVSKREVVFNQTSHDQQDVAYGDGYACFVYREARSSGAWTGVKCTLIDIESGAKLVNDSTLISSTTVISPRVVFVGNAFFIFYLDGFNLYCRVIATSAPSTVGTQTSIVFSAALISKNFDACAAGTLAQVAWVNNDGVTSVQVAAVTRTGTTPSVSLGPTNVISEANVTNTSIQALCIAPYVGAINSFVGVIHTAGGALASGLVGAVLFNNILAVSTAATALDGATPPVASATHLTAVGVGTNIQTFYDQQSSYNSANLRPIRGSTRTITLGSTGLGNVTTINSATFRINAAEASGPQGPFIAGKAFYDGTDVFLPVCMLENYFRPTAPLGTNTDTLSTQCSFFLLRIDGTSGSPTVVASALYRTLGLVDNLGGGAPSIGTPCSTPALDSGYGICLQERGRLELVAGINNTPTGLSFVTLTPRATSPGISTQLSESTYFTGGQLGNYDGKQIAQHGFPNFPEGMSAVVAATGAGSLTVGVHQIVAVYEWTDGAGNRHQSQPSLPVSVTVANATDQINCLIPTTQLAQSAGYDSTISTLRIAVYMTAAGGVTFYRTVSDFTAPAENNVLTSTVAYTIGTPQTMPDSRLTQNELLYTQPLQAGTTLPNQAPGPTGAITVSQNRLWYAKADQPFEYGYSQEPVANTGLQFNETLGGNVPSSSGGIVALVELDEKTIILCARKLFVVYGNGPTPSGGFNNFSDPQPIPSDVGCSEARSVIAIPSGILFKSEKGWYLLGRDLSVNYVGDGVARYDANGVTSAVMMEDRQEVRFTSLDGPTLVYSYLNDAWSTFNFDAAEAYNTGALTSGIWWAGAGRYVHLHPSTSRTGAGLFIDTPGQYYDDYLGNDPIWPEISARTSWLHVASLEGFQRARRLYFTATGNATAPVPTFTLKVDFDDQYGNDAAGSYTTSFSYPVGNTQALDFRHRLRRQKCKSVAFTFTESAFAEDSITGITGIQALSLEIGLKPGVNRLPASQTVE